jgi:hypothetical protein
MEENAIGKRTEHFGKVSDPRVRNATRYKLIDLIVIAICAVICRADGWSDVALFVRSKLSWLKKILELPHGIPSHDTFLRVFGLINPEEFRRSFLEWVQTIQKLMQGEVIAIDGKQLHGSKDEGNGQSAIDMVSAWATANKLLLGQVKVDEKSNGIPAIPRLLELLDITGCLVTIDTIAFREDLSRVRKDHAPENLAILRHMAINILKQEKSAKVGNRLNDYKRVGMKPTCSRSWRFEIRLPYLPDIMYQT